MDELFAILLSYAALYGGYADAPVPEVDFMPHAFFVVNVCGGKECNVVGWYYDDDIVFIDEKHMDMTVGFNTSLVVHEFAHYLQGKSGEFDTFSCEDSVVREREAYYIQSMYMVDVLTTGFTMTPPPAKCAYQ